MSLWIYVGESSWSTGLELGEIYKAYAEEQGTALSWGGPLPYHHLFMDGALIPVPAFLFRPLPRECSL